MSEFVDKVRIKNVLIKHETDRAVLAVIEGDEYWVPKSQIDDDSEVWKKDEEGTLVVSEWWAEQEGLA